MSEQENEIVQIKKRRDDPDFKPRRFYDIDKAMNWRPGTARAFAERGFCGFNGEVIKLDSIASGKKERKSTLHDARIFQAHTTNPLWGVNLDQGGDQPIDFWECIMQNLAENPTKLAQMVKQLQLAAEPINKPILLENSELVG